MVFAIVVDTRVHILGPLENASLEFPLVFAELLSCGPGPGSTSAALGIFNAPHALANGPIFLDQNGSICH